MKNLKKRILDKKKARLEFLNDLIIAISSFFTSYRYECQYMQFANYNWMQSL